MSELNYRLRVKRFESFKVEDSVYSRTKASDNSSKSTNLFYKREEYLSVHMVIIIVQCIDNNLLFECVLGGLKRPFSDEESLENQMQTNCMDS